MLLAIKTLRELMTIDGRSNRPRSSSNLTRVMRRALRYGFRLGLLGGIAFALFRIIDARRSKGSGGADTSWPGGSGVVPGPSSTGSPSATMASPGPGPVVAEPPQPDLVDPVMLTTIAGLPRDDEAGSGAGNGMGALGSASPAPAKRVTPKKAAPAKKAASPAKAVPADKAPVVKKAAAKKPAPPKPSDS